jgi:hypothetical protein
MDTDGPNAAKPQPQRTANVPVRSNTASLTPPQRPPLVPASRFHQAPLRHGAITLAANGDVRGPGQRQPHRLNSLPSGRKVASLYYGATWIRDRGDTNLHEWLPNSWQFVKFVSRVPLYPCPSASIRGCTAVFRINRSRKRDSGRETKFSAFCPAVAAFPAFA